MKEDFQFLHPTLPGASEIKMSPPRNCAAGQYELKCLEGMEPLVFNVFMAHGGGVDAVPEPVERGSLGAQRVNEEILALMRDYTAQHPEIFHIHATGKIEYEDAMTMAKEYGIDNKPNIRLLEYIYDMPLWEKAADAVICRAGAMTIAEMALLGKACILIPSPNVANNHQYENAKRLADAGAAIMHEEKNLSPETLRIDVQNVLENAETAAALSKSIKEFAKPEAANDIYKDLLLLTSEEIRNILKKD